VASVLIAGLHRSSHASSVQYSVLDLGTLGGSQSQPAAINALGQVAGYSNLQGDGVIHAFLFDGTQLRDLGTLGGPDSVAYGINAYGTVVGYAQNLSGVARGFIYSAGVTLDLGVAGDTVTAVAVNDANVIAGTRSVSGNDVAFILDSSGAHDLGTLGGRSSRVMAINAGNQVVGEADGVPSPSGYDNRGFLWSAGTMTNLSTLFGRTITYGADINDHRHMVAVVQAGGLESGVFYRNGDVVDLGGSPYGCVPSAVNNDDLIVGHFGSGPYHACMIQGGTFVDLNTVLPPGYGWTLEGGIAVSDAGHIAARGCNAEGHLHAFLLSPTAPTTSTTTTTLPCTTARCTFDTAEMSAACARRTIPASVTSKLTKAETLIDHAATNPPKKARKLLVKARKALKQAGTTATRLAKGKKAKLSAACAGALADAANQVAAGL